MNNLTKNLRQGILDNTIDPFDEKSIGWRNAINPILRNVFKLAILNYKTEVLNKPTMEKGKKYVFASNHSYEDDIIINTCHIPSHTYLLMGGTDQIKYNPLMPATVLNGIIRVDMFDKISRSECIKHCEKVLEHANVQIFVEGIYCDSPNKFHEGFFNSPYILSNSKKVEVIPTINVFDAQEHKAYLMYGNPIKGYEMSQKEFKEKLSEEISTSMMHIISNYIKPLDQTQRGYNDINNYYEERFKQYAKDDTILGWRENLHGYKDFDRYTNEDFIEDTKSIYKNKEIQKYSPLYYEIKYRDLYDFRKFCERKIGFTIPDTRNSKIDLLARRLRKIFKTKNEVIDFIMATMLLSTDKELKNYIINKTNDFNIDDTIKYIIEDFLSSVYQNTEEVVYEIDNQMKTR